MLHSPSSFIKSPWSNLISQSWTLLHPSSVKRTRYLTQKVLKKACFLTKCPQAPLAPLAAFSRSGGITLLQNFVKTIILFLTFPYGIFHILRNYLKIKIPHFVISITFNPGLTVFTTCVKILAAVLSVSWSTVFANSWFIRSEQNVSIVELKFDIVFSYPKTNTQTCMPIYATSQRQPNPNHIVPQWGTRGTP